MIDSAERMMCRLVGYAVLLVVFEHRVYEGKRNGFVMIRTEEHRSGFESWKRGRVSRDCDDADVMRC